MEVLTHTVDLQCQGCTLQHQQYTRIAGEVAVPVGGVSRVLEVSGLLSCEQVDLGTDTAEVAGTARLTVVYCDDESQVQSLHVQCGWSHRCELPGASPRMKGRCVGVLQEAGARVSAMGLSIEGVAGLTLACWETQTHAAVTALADEGEGIFCQDTSLQIFRELGFASAQRTIAGDASLPSGLPDIARVLCATPCLRILEQHPISGKVFCRGECDVALMYADATGKPTLAELTFAFDAALDLDGCEVPGARIDAAWITESLEIIPEADGTGALRFVRMACGCRVFTQAAKPEMVTLLQDAYSASHELALERTDICLAEAPRELSAPQTLATAITLPEGAPPLSGICAVVCQPRTIDAEAEQGSVTVTGSCTCTVYYHSVGEAGVFCVSGELPVMATIADPAITPGVTQVKACLGTCQAIATAPFEIECRANLALTVTTQSQRTVAIVTTAQAADERPSGGCCCLYFVQPGDTAWEIGRRYGLSPQALAELNPDLGETLALGQRMTLYKAL